MTVLVTGATGFLGRSLVERLLTDGERVRILVRSPERARPLTALGAEPITGEITDGRALEEALRDVSVVYHLAGRLFVPGVPADEYRRTHVEGTRTLLAALEGQSRTPRLVHCSTTGVLGVTGSEAAAEDAPFRPTNAYEETKAEAEMLVREAASGGLPAVVVRPGLVYGPGDLHLLGFFRTVLRGLFRPIGREQVWLHPVYIDDMTEAMVLCGSHAAAIGDRFHVAGREPVTIAKLAAQIAEAGGVAQPRGIIPLSLARGLAAAGDLLPDRLKPLAPLTRSRLAFLTHSRVYDVTRAREVLGFSARTNLETGIAHTIAWYREEGYLPIVQAASGDPALRNDRRGRVLASPPLLGPPHVEFRQIVRAIRGRAREDAAPTPIKDILGEGNRR